MLEAVKRLSPHLILLDVMLPDVSGFELCGEIKRLAPPHGTIPIIFLTAKGNRSTSCAASIWASTIMS
ncbi:response regulator [Paenibacillus sp. P26]|nr:response regulator [Paenibacillus sp. P26]